MFRLNLLGSLRAAMSRVLGFLRPGNTEHEFDEELQAHLEMAIEDKIRSGLTPKEARRQAHLSLGNLTQLREDASSARGLPWIGNSWLDIKLGFRMLRKSWGLTLVAGFAMTVVIALAAVAFEILSLMSGTDLPLDQGDRIVALHAWDQESGDSLGTSAADFERWRDALRSVEQTSAFRLVDRNLQVSEAGSAPGEAVELAEISASAFQVARVLPALGRTLLPEDEHAAADPVIVLSHRAWSTRFQADPSILGRRIRLDGILHTVVGVMPEDFGFPISQHYWVPLHIGPGSYTPDAGSDELFVFARLKDGVSIRQAHAELMGLGLLESLESAEAHTEAIAPEPTLRVLPYAKAFLSDIDSWVLNLAVLVFMMLLIPPCMNVAILVYARTITRQGEFAARFVLGASRFRIVFQLFLEILVLSSCAGVLALGIARFAVQRLVTSPRANGEMPFWMDINLSLRTVLAVAILAVFAALIAGVIPALRATGKSMQAGLKSLGGQPQQARLGAVWTILVVLQVAISTALLPTSAEMVWGTIRSGTLGPGFAAEKFVTAHLKTEQLKTGHMERADFTEAQRRFEQRQLDLVRRLESEPTIAAVTVSAEIPGEGPWLHIVKEPLEVEAGETRAEETRAEETRAEETEEETGGISIGSQRLAQINRVDEHFFDVLEVPILAGRAFESADFDPSRRTVIVNRAFSLNVLGGANPLGRRIRYRETEGESLGVPTGEGHWFEIVGVVADIHRHAANQIVYHPDRGEPGPAVALAMRVQADAANAAGVLRSATWSVDPALRLSDIKSLDEIYRERELGNWAGAGTLVACTLSLLLLSAAGIYALMSFTVGRRRKEIGIRAAVGASPMRLIAAVFRRALVQIGIGAFIGIWIALLVDHYLPVQQLGGWELPGAIPAATLFFVAVAMMALVGPARRGLQVDPVEELREG